MMLNFKKGHFNKKILGSERLFISAQQTMSSISAENVIISVCLRD